MAPVQYQDYDDQHIDDVDRADHDDQHIDDVDRDDYHLFLSGGLPTEIIASQPLPSEINLRKMSFFTQLTNANNSNILLNKSKLFKHQGKNPIDEKEIMAKDHSECQ